ncbi:MAG TPA: 3-deoxy-manno-octulosonate cytidylyltransferase, partial [bacterium]|nr:3-deoxy-manno-octulosonate cytidylyltransferase [bacterium]
MDTIIGIVITARVHQGRWPEKIMADIGGKPMIEQV